MRPQTIYVFDDAWKEYSEVLGTMAADMSRDLGVPVTFTGMRFSEKDRLAPQIRLATDESLGLSDGSIDVTAVLLDLTFENQCGDRYLATEAIAGHAIEGQSLLQEITGSGLPTILFTNSSDPQVAHLVGSMNVDWISKDELRNGGPGKFAGRLATILREQNKHLKFNETTLLTENEFALVYDREELGSLATRGVIVWENERVLAAARQAIQDLDRPLRVLDIGCGTGRFEELLLSHSDTRNHIEKIVAVDFAPQYLTCARERLTKLGKGDLLNRITFSRRVAEALHLPDQSFDLVLAAFGVPCFSRYDRSIPEAARVLRRDGTLVLTAYNSESLNFEYEEEFNREASGTRRSFFCANIDRSRDEMLLPGQAPFPCKTFTPAQFRQVLQPYVHVADDDIMGNVLPYRPLETFPVLYGCAPRDFIEQLSGGGDVQLPAENGALSYMSDALMRSPGFSTKLYHIDRQLCRLSPLRYRGHYMNVIARKKT